MARVNLPNDVNHSAVSSSSCDSGPASQCIGTVIDLYSGAGGLSLGASRAGFSVVGAVELDDSALDAHRQNFPHTAHVAADVATLRGDTLATALNLVTPSAITGVIGGPPCQGFSIIGKSRFDDPRNSLFDEFFRLVAELRPRFFLAENVPGILHGKNAAVLERALSRVARAYVVLSPIVLDARDFGAPTTRRRAFFLGYLRSVPLSLTEKRFAPDPTLSKTYVRDALRGLPARIRGAGKTRGWRTVPEHGTGYFASRLTGHVPKDVGDPSALDALRTRRRVSGFLGTVHSSDVRRRYARIAQGARDPVSKSHRLDPDGFCPTLRAGTGPERGRFQAVRPLHPHQNRVITPREAARLQGFPDWFQFPSTKWHSFRCIGSSVSPILAERLFSIIAAAFEQADALHTGTQHDESTL